MRRIRFLALALMVLIAIAVDASAEVLVIVNKDNPTGALSRRQLVDIYMGRYQNFSDDLPALPLDQPPDLQVRARFYKTLVGKSVAEVNAYWARLLFTGRASPPRVMVDSSAVLKVIRENRSAIGYIDSSDLDDSVKVVGRVE